MTDFAGQCSYYASHQIFLSPGAFFILVLNMEKNFDDKVGEEVCCQEGSVYGGWTHRDYLEFWMKSIHQYGSDKAPVILVGTHSENKTEKEKELFFREVWKTLDRKKKSLQKHIDVKRRFAVEFHDNESIEKLKLSIADVVCKIAHWGEELPQSWAMFETFLQEKKFPKILSRSELEMFNEILPEGIKLQISDMSPMLQFFHDIREIIHFNHQFLNKVIFLDVQWFADAFRNVITDKNHAQEDLFEFASEWDKFNETGELDEALLSAIWRMNNNGYLEHKEDIMMYMEKLGLLAKMSDKTWYVPCMNKMQFPVDCFSSYPASSILCYTFGILPVEIFHRLVATCMQIPWEIFSDEERGCIFQKTAILVFHDQHHNILLGMTQTEIQVQVFVVEGEVNVSTCHQIRENIERILHNLSNTFQKKSDFQVEFKCKSTGFCDSKESAVISESKFFKETFQCPSCPANKKHRIISEEIKKYWEQTNQSNPSTSKASGQDLEGRSRFAKLGMATNDVLNQAYRDILESEVPPSDIENKVNSLSSKERKNLKLNPDQEDLLKKAKNTLYKEFDISFTYKIIRNICLTIPKPTKGKWGEEPTAAEVTVGDDIERIRLIRNRLAAHVSSASTPQKEFNDTWLMMSDICQRLEAFTGKIYLAELNNIKILTLKREDEESIIQKLNMEHHKMLKTLMSDMQEMKLDVKDIKKAVMKPENTG
ncbi:probable serine/threonine-protein kinase pats1 [Saccostrea cucullata]|uniref:probable serine/threonine-protein kinase pats1 n=1 Tax=Saccostrea cuccullata TaxID=36930 RepID=UPI002ED45678